MEFASPFFGAGGMEFHLFALAPLESVWINDIDKGIAAIWTAVVQSPKELCAKVKDFEPSVAHFELFKRELTSGLRNEDVVDLAFKKIAIHQMSYSGLGTMSGGPLGGTQQSSKYPIDCRWSPAHICKTIKKAHAMLSAMSVRDGACSSLDFGKLIQNSGKRFLYLDPPYYVKGPELYQFSFKRKDHTRLANALKKTKNPWLLSYDDHQVIRELYDWAHILEIPISYTINTSRKKVELLIAPDPSLLAEPEREVDLFEEV